jgi:hypothetical protein
MGKKIGKRLFNKVVNGNPLVISEDGFLSNGYWAVKKELVEAILDKDVNLLIDREVSSLVGLLTVEPLMEQEWVLNKNVIERIERQFYFYDNVDLIDAGGFYMLDNVDESIKAKYAINKLYYDFIQRAVESKGLMKIYAIYETIYLMYDGKKEKYDQGFSTVCFVWLPHHSGDLKDLLGACMPILLNE